MTSEHLGWHAVGSCLILVASTEQFCYNEADIFLEKALR